MIRALNDKVIRQIGNVLGGAVTHKERSALRGRLDRAAKVIES